MGGRFAYILSSLLIFGGPITATPLELQLSVPRSVYKKGDSVVVRALVVNPLSSSEVWLLKRSFWLTPYSSPMDGDLGLSIWVMGPDGKGLEGTRAIMLVARMKTHPSMFLPMYPGQVFGQDIPLDGQGLEYKMAALGRYRISAMLSPAQPRQWYDRWLRGPDHQREDELKRDQLFTGILTSPSVDVELVE